MNSTLPPARDLPPHRHARIRARLEQEVTGGRRAVRFAPLLVAGAAAAAVVALVAVMTPGQQRNIDAATSTTGQAVETTAAETRRPVIPGLSPERIAEIEQGCVASTLREGKATLYQYVTDEVGTLAVLYTAAQQLSCTVDGPTMPYNASSAMVWDTGWLPGALALDQLSSANGGAGGKPEHADQHGYDVAIGRVTAEVAKVVYLHGGRSVEARIANGAFVARIPHPADWVMPEGWDQLGVVHAYDAQGTLLGEWRNEWDPTRCWVRPDGVIVAGARDLDPAKCQPAVAWR